MQILIEEVVPGIKGLDLSTPRRSGTVTAPRGVAQTGGGNYLRDIAEAVDYFDQVVRTIAQIAIDYPQVMDMLGQSGLSLADYQKLADEMTKTYEQLQKKGSGVSEASVKGAASAVGNFFKKAVGKAKSAYEQITNKEQRELQNLMKEFQLEQMVSRAERALAKLESSPRVKAAENALAVLRTVFDFSGIAGTAQEEEEAREVMGQPKSVSYLGSMAKKGAESYGQSVGNKWKYAASKLSDYKNLQPEEMKELANTLRQLASKLDEMDMDLKESASKKRTTIQIIEE